MSRNLPIYKCIYAPKNVFGSGEGPPYDLGLYSMMPA